MHDQSRRSRKTSCYTDVGQGDIHPVRNGSPHSPRGVLSGTRWLFDNFNRSRNASRRLPTTRPAHSITTTPSNLRTYHKQTLIQVFFCRLPLSGRFFLKNPIPATGRGAQDLEAI